ncbi:MAG: tyrosine-type recombinase/integrase [Bryobacterales bacterium]|nr:tyrosine-type recombinase/integrase [Bryobacterales bacterium]
MRMDRALGEWVEDMRARRLALSTQRDYVSTFSMFGKWLAAEDLASGLDEIDVEDVDEDLLREWRRTWTQAPGTQTIRIHKMRTFFGWCMSRGWHSGPNPARGLRPPRYVPRPTMPMEPHEVAAMLDAAKVHDMPKERALLLLLRYSGLAIQDAATLRRDALEGCELTLRRAKTGVAVIGAVPVEAADALRALDRPGEHFFWSGRGQKASTASYWRNRLKRVAALAGVEDFRPHRMRDTFAVELLKAGVAMEDVKDLLGHSSVLTTEKHYAPWNRARARRLRDIAARAHGGAG